MGRSSALPSWETPARFRRLRGSGRAGWHFPGSNTPSPLRVAPRALIARRAGSQAAPISAVARLPPWLLGGPSRQLPEVTRCHSYRQPDWAPSGVHALLATGPLQTGALRAHSTWDFSPESPEASSDPEGAQLCTAG